MTPPGNKGAGSGVRAAAEVGDQARRLKQMASQSATDAVPLLPALAITGGKGGVGKTCVAVNLGLVLAGMGLKPLLVDCDLGLANADVLLGVTPQSTLFDVVTAGRPLSGAITSVTAPNQNRLAFAPAASGREELANLQPRQLQRLVRELGKAASAYDLLILDTAAGIGREVCTFLQASRIVLVVVTPEPTSLTDAYALIKVLEQKQPGKDVRVLVNQSANDDEGQTTFNRLRKVAAAYLQRDLIYLGCVPRDRAVADAVRTRSPLALGANGPALGALRSLALRMKNERWKT